MGWPKGGKGNKGNVVIHLGGAAQAPVWPGQQWQTQQWGQWPPQQPFPQWAGGFGNPAHPCPFTGFCRILG